MTGADVARARYAGGPAALEGTIEGKSDLMFEPLPASLERLRPGKLRALAVTGTTRAPALPDLPALSDFVPGYEGASAATGIGAAGGTPHQLAAPEDV
jgi:tripartite-type tricarboxylate transporter receptor subunit TctC